MKVALSKLIEAQFSKRNETIPDSKQEIIGDIKNYIQSRDGDYSNWCVGIGQNVQDIFRNRHKVKGDWWMYKYVHSFQAAKEVKDYFVNTLGADGDTKDADDTANIVYVYKKLVHTVA